MFVSGIMKLDVMARSVRMDNRRDAVRSLIRRVQAL